MEFLNLFKSLLFNEEMKNILPLVVSLACFCVVRNFFIIFIDKKRVNNILINALSLTITVLAYFAFIKIVGLARFTYIFDSVPFILYCFSVVLSTIRDLTFVLYLFVSSNFLKVSVFNLLDNCALVIFYDAIKMFIVWFKIKIEFYIKQILFTIQIIIYRHTEIYKLNCSFSC